MQIRTFKLESDETNRSPKWVNKLWRKLSSGETVGCLSALLPLVHLWWSADKRLYEASLRANKVICRSRWALRQQCLLDTVLIEYNWLFLSIATSSLCKGSLLKARLKGSSKDTRHAPDSGVQREVPGICLKTNISRSLIASGYHLQIDTEHLQINTACASSEISSLNLVSWKSTAGELPEDKNYFQTSGNLNAIATCLPKAAGYRSPIYELLWEALGD